MDNDTFIVTIQVARLNGKKSTSKGKEYWELSGTDKKKYRVWTEAMYNRFQVGKTYDVEISEMEGSFTNDKGINVDYKLQTIHNIAKMPDVEEAPLDFGKFGNISTPQEKPKHRDSDTFSTPASEAQTYKSRDFEAENRGKIRSLLLQSLVAMRGLEPLTAEDKEIINDYVEYAMKGSDKNE